MKKQYELDSENENSLDVVVQHMIAGGFSVQEVVDKLRVTEEYVQQCITPTKVD